MIQFYPKTMRQALLAWGLPLMLLVLLLGAAGLCGTSKSAQALSMAALCHREGNSLVLQYSGETWVVSGGAPEDMAGLSRYLRKIGETEVDLLCCHAETSALALLQDAVEVRSAVPPAALRGRPLLLGPADCSIEAAQDGDLTVSVEHCGHAVSFLLDSDAPVIHVLAERVEKADTSEHSVRILCDARGVRIRPDFSAWLD